MNKNDTISGFHVSKAEFVASAVQSTGFPVADRPEVAFAGRSNVGKSSLLNRLLNRRNLARTGSTPGRTQTINFFNVNDKLYFVDLPGFGYAKVPEAVRAGWKGMVEGYLTAPRDLRAVLLLVDIRRQPAPEESNLLEWLDYHDLTVAVVATKSDKVNRSRHRPRAEEISRSYGLRRPPFIFSAKSGEGRESIWSWLLEHCQTDPRGES